MKNDPQKCDKRQREVRKETESHRCIDPKALSTYLQIVDVPTCEGCPLLQAKLANKGCGEKHWSDELLSVEVVARDAPEGADMSLEKHSYEQPCHHRWNGKCRITNRPINPDICKACDQETADHMATLSEQAVGYMNEVRKWIREGRPVRTPERVQEILKICKGDPESPDPDLQQPCGMYDPVKEACKSCGCATNDKEWAVRNGIKMATKICPLGLWK